MSATGIGDLAKRSKMPSLTVVIAGPMPKAPPLPKKAEEPDDDEDDDDDDEDDDEESPEEADNKRIVAEATKALQGKSKHPDEAINDFIETFGKRELTALREMLRGEDTDEAMASGRLVEGPGRGMEDRIKAKVGNQPVLLSDGEYVFPADVVSMLGDGSTQAGVRMLEAMIERVRTSKTGSSKQAKAFDRGLLPA